LSKYQQNWTKQRWEYDFSIEEIGELRENQEEMDRLYPDTLEQLEWIFREEIDLFLLAFHAMDNVKVRPCNNLELKHMISLVFQSSAMVTEFLTKLKAKEADRRFYNYAEIAKLIGITIEAETPRELQPNKFEKNYLKRVLDEQILKLYF
jgi:hypothetical protein